MGLGGISPFQLLIILVIVLLIFGTKKLRGLGGDLGGAIKGFKKAMKDEDVAEKLDEAKENVAEAGENVKDAASEATETVKTEAVKKESSEAKS